LASKVRSNSAAQQISSKFVRTVAGLLKPKNPRKGHIQLILLAAEVLQERLQQSVSSLNRARLDLESLREDLEARTEEISNLREEATNNLKTIGDLQAKVAQLGATVLDEKTKNEALDKHWQVVVQQEIAGLSARLRRQLEHEVSEIQLCLTGNTPNLEMASRRITRVADIVAKL
jgi:chromosome segregation ATPase